MPAAAVPTPAAGRRGAQSIYSAGHRQDAGHGGNAGTGIHTL